MSHLLHSALRRNAIRIHRVEGGKMCSKHLHITFIYIRGYFFFRCLSPSYPLPSLLLLQGAGKILQKQFSVLCKQQNLLWRWQMATVRCIIIEISICNACNVLDCGNMHMENMWICARIVCRCYVWFWAIRLLFVLFFPFPFGRLWCAEKYCEWSKKTKNRRKCVYNGSREENWLLSDQQ